MINMDLASANKDINDLMTLESYMEVIRKWMV